MIDFVRVYYGDKTKLENMILTSDKYEKVYSVLDLKSGEVSYPYKAKIDNMEIVVNDKAAYVRNSIHKLNNFLIEGIEHNHNDFNYSQLCATIDYLKENVVDITTSNLTQLEFGININVPISAKKLIKQSLLMHNFMRHSTEQKFKGKGYMLTFQHYNYTIKIYDKALQYSIKGEHILRFEIKFTNNKEFNRLGVYNLNDLKSKKNLTNLFEYMINRLDELIIIDDLFISEIPEKDLDLLNMYSSFSFWEALTKANKRQVKSNHKKKYLYLLHKYNLLKTKVLLRNQLIHKFQELLTK